jgi:hypothetical protein
MQGKKQSNAKKQREIGALSWPPGQTSLPALVKFPSGPYASRKYVVMLNHAVMVSKLLLLNFESNFAILYLRQNILGNVLPRS